MLLILLLGIGTFVAYKTEFFIVDKIVYKGDSLITGEFIKTNAEEVKGSNIIVFNKDMKDFSGLIEKAHSALKSHSKYKRMEETNDNTNQVFIFKHPQDESKEVKVALLLFNYYAN